MTPLERAARALHHARMKRQHPKPDAHPWENLSQREQALLRVDVRAVIAAVREEASELSGEAYRTIVALRGESETVIAREVFKVMIDAMLAEGA